MSITQTIRSAVVGLMFAAALSAFADDSARVDINTADAEMIADALVGVGMAKAQAIINYRDENGRFNDIYELTYVKGIGDSIVQRNEERIALDMR